MAVCAPRINVTRCTRDGQLWIDGESMQRVAFAVISVSPLWAPVTQRGSDLLIPGRTGVIGMPRRGTSTTYALRMIIDGGFDAAGSPTTNTGDGLAANIDWLEANVSGPVAIGDGQRQITYTRPGGAMLSGRGHVTLQLGDRVRDFFRAVLAIEVASGTRFT